MNISHVHELEKLIVLKYPLSEAICRFNAIANKIPMEFFTEVEKSSTILMEPQNSLYSQSNFGKR